MHRFASKTQVKRNRRHFQQTREKSCEYLILLAPGSIYKIGMMRVRALRPRSKHPSGSCRTRKLSALSRAAGILIILSASCLSLSEALFAFESETFRLLSVSDSGKIILVSKMPAKTKYMLDAATAKITVNGKPAEFSDLVQYSMIQVKFELRKGKKEGIDIDGIATEINMTPPHEQ